jgi:hypothetical protein
VHRCDGILTQNLLWLHVELSQRGLINPLVHVNEIALLRDLLFLILQVDVDR